METTRGNGVAKRPHCCFSAFFSLPAEKKLLETAVAASRRKPAAKKAKPYF